MYKIELAIRLNQVQVNLSAKLVILGTIRRVFKLMKWGEHTADCSIACLHQHLAEPIVFRNFLESSNWC